MSKTTIEASVIDNTLIVSFLSKKEPRVWRMDMGRFLSTALEIKENQGHYSLIIRPGNGMAEEVGIFSDRKKAVEALEQITAALVKGKETVQPKTGGGGFVKFLKFIFKALFLLLIVAVAFVIWSKGHLPVNMGDVMAPPAQTQPEPQPQPGVPAPADKVIGQ